MKKLTAALALLLLAALLLTGCKRGTEETPGDAQVEEETPEPTPEITATPEPQATATPAPTMQVSAYKYDTVINSTLQVTFQYPSHWTNDPGKSTICFLEPVASGEHGARLAVASKQVAKAPDTTSLKKQLTTFAEKVEATFASFTLAENVDTKVPVFNTDGISQSYTARDSSGVRITGYILMAYNSGNRHIYVLHFSCPSNRYEELSPVIEKVRQSLAVVK